MSDRINRKSIFMIVLFCMVFITPATGVYLVKADEPSLCHKHMGCTCKCPAGSDSKRLHEPTNADFNDDNVPSFQPHYDVFCSKCNKYAKKKGKNIRSGYFCPVTNNWR